MNQVIQKQSFTEKLKGRYENNMQFFKTFIPDIYKQLIENKENPTITIDSKTGSLHRMNEGKSVYPEGPIEYAQKEVTNFLALTESISYAPRPGTINLAHMIKDEPFKKSSKLYERIHKENNSLKPCQLNIVIFGIGLGYHIEMLVNKKRFTHITIIENDIKVFKASLYSIKWDEILKFLGDKGSRTKSITFLINDTTNDEIDFESQIKTQCYRMYPSISLSTIIYNHYADESTYKKLKDIVNQFSVHIKMVYERVGPEAHRLLNANENTRNNRKIINFEKSKLIGKKSKIAIIGAGPSLDIYADVLINNLDQFFIISAGSALSSILEMGITPDLHFELEYQKLATELLEHLNKSHDLSKIPLVCTYEAHPIYTRLFKSVNMFVPETSELSGEFDSEYILRKGGVTCTNGATAFASRLSNNDIYLFGVDFANTNNQHHSKTNISQSNNLPGNLHRLNESLNAQLIVESTKGEKIATRVALNSARLAMIELMTMIDNKVFNCSHGAHIKGTTALMTEELDKLLFESKSEKPQFHLITKLASDFPVHERTEKMLKLSFNESRNILKHLKKDINSREVYLHKIVWLYNQIIGAYQNRHGQFRNIMSLNRYPILLLFALINFSPEKNLKEVASTWAKEYASYLNYLEKKIFKYINADTYYVDEEWTSHQDAHKRNTK